MQSSDVRPAPGSKGALAHWFERNILELGREMRLSYLPPLMVYLAYGIQALTGIVGTFFVKDYLGLSAAFLAALGFWVGIPWALKMPVGHVVDLLWRYKAGLVYVGAALITASLLIMIGLISDPAAMRSVMPAEYWFVLAALLAPIGYVLQDAVADAMTVEAIPLVDEHGKPTTPEARKLMHTTMQTLGRVALIGGTVLVSLVNIFVFQGTEALSKEAKVPLYSNIYKLALIIPIVSIAGVLLHGFLKRREAARLRALGSDAASIERALGIPTEKTKANWWILGGSLLFAVITIVVGLARFIFGPAETSTFSALLQKYGQEVIFVGSFAVIAFLMSKLLRELGPAARITLLGTALIIFVFRAIPGPGPGVGWWQIDVLKFDEAFLAKLSLVVSFLTLLGLFVFRRLMGEKSISYIVAMLAVIGFLLSLPIVGMYYGLHEWTSRMTGGVVDQRFIAVVNEALESPLGQISMVPMLAWIANSAPSHLKATFFAVMASFTNLALSASQLGTKYLNVRFKVTREVKDQVTGAITTPADYSELGVLLITVSAIALLVPLLAIVLVRAVGWKSA